MAAATPVTVQPRRIGEYDLFESIGTGSYSTVKRAIREDTKAVVAVKVVEKQRISRDWNRQQLRRELELTRNFSHPNVCGLLDAMQTSRNVYLVFPYAPNGDLFGAIVAAGRLNENVSRRWFRQLASGVHHVHSCGVVHRDIKPENILIDNDKNVLLSDFGFCASQAPGDRVYALCGSPHTIAPEVLSSDSGYCGVAADIWSLGIVLFVMLAGRYPYVASNMDDLLPEILTEKWTFPRSFPPAAASLVRKMLVVDPKARASLPDLLADQWLCNNLPTGDSTSSSTAGPNASFGSSRSALTTKTPPQSSGQGSRASVNTPAATSLCHDHSHIPTTPPTNSSSHSAARAVAGLDLTMSPQPHGGGTSPYDGSCPTSPSPLMVPPTREMGLCAVPSAVPNKGAAAGPSGVTSPLSMSMMTSPIKAPMLTSPLPQWGMGMSGDRVHTGTPTSAFSA